MYYLCNVFATFVVEIVILDESAYAENAQVMLQHLVLLALLPGELLPMALHLVPYPPPQVRQKVRHSLAIEESRVQQSSEDLGSLLPYGKVVVLVEGHDQLLHLGHVLLIAGQGREVGEHRYLVEGLVNK